MKAQKREQQRVDEPDQRRAQRPRGRRPSGMSMLGCSLYLKQAPAPKKTTQAKPITATSPAQAAGCAVT